MGAAIGTTAANATSVPASLAEVDPAWQSAASTATAQLAVDVYKRQVQSRKM